MTTKKITADEVSQSGVCSLPTRPTESVTFGGKGYTSYEMKAAFDKLPRLIIERFNLLLSDLTDGRILEDIPTGVETMPNLKALIEGFENEKFAIAIQVFGTPLRSFLLQLRSDVDMLMDAIGVTPEAIE